MVKYSHRMVPEIFQTFWAGMAAGEFITDAAEAAGSYRKQALGGLRPAVGCVPGVAATSRAGV